MTERTTRSVPCPCEFPGQCSAAFPCFPCPSSALPSQDAAGTEHAAGPDGRSSGLHKTCSLQRHGSGCRGCIFLDVKGLFYDWQTCPYRGSILGLTNLSMCYRDCSNYWLNSQWFINPCHGVEVICMCVLGAVLQITLLNFRRWSHIS